MPHHKGTAKKRGSGGSSDDWEKSFSTAVILFAVTQRGLTVADLEYIDISTMLDFIIVYNNLMIPEEEGGVKNRRALVESNIDTAEQLYLEGKITQEEYEEFLRSAG